MKRIILGVCGAAMSMSVLVVSGCAEETSGTTAGESTSAENVDDEKKEPDYTSSQKAAISAAQNYVDTMPFSRKGLVDQLSSSAGDQFPKKDAEFAVRHIDVDWNEEAVEAVENYQATMPMSQQALRQQLTSAYGDKFTPEQADYAIKKAY